MRHWGPPVKGPNSTFPSAPLVPTTTFTFLFAPFFTSLPPLTVSLAKHLGFEAAAPIYISPLLGPLIGGPHVASMSHVASKMSACFYMLIFFKYPMSWHLFLLSFYLALSSMSIFRETSERSGTAQNEQNNKPRMPPLVKVVWINDIIWRGFNHLGVLLHFWHIPGESFCLRKD